MYLAIQHEWSSVLEFHAAVLLDIERGHLHWGDSFEHLECHSLRVKQRSGWSNVHHPRPLSSFVVIFKETIVSSQRIIMVRFAGSENGFSMCVQNAGSRLDKSRLIQNFRLIAPCYQGLLIRRKLLCLLLDNLIRCCLTLIQHKTL